MIVNIIGGIILLALLVGIYVQIPPEDPEIIEARKRYGKAGE